MPEAIGKDIASYISALRDTAPVPAETEPVEPVSRREPAPSKIVAVSISKEALYHSRDQ